MLENYIFNVRVCESNLSDLYFVGGFNVSIYLLCFICGFMDNKRLIYDIVNIK